MRKLRPNDVIADFSSQAEELVQYFGRVTKALKGTANELADKSALAEQTFLNAATAFECFLSDLFVAFLNRDASQYQDEVFRRITESVKEKQGEWHSQRLSFSKAKHIRASDVITLLDPNGWNVTFKSAALLKTRATEWLIDSFATRITGLSTDDEQVIDTTKAIRDFIAHRSKSAKVRMNEALEKAGESMAITCLGRGDHQIEHVGAFLRAECGGATRLQLYVERLKDIAHRLTT